MNDPQSKTEVHSFRAALHTALSGLGRSPQNPRQVAALERVAEAATQQFLKRIPLNEATEPQPLGDGEFAEMMTEIKSGSINAVWLVIERYEPHIRRVISRRLSAQLRSRFDTMDFVQMVWKSLFEDPQRVYAMHSPTQLGAYLSKMAQRKVLAEYRRRTGTQRQDVAREQPFDSQQACVPHETPSQLAMARERWEQLLVGLPARHREIVRLRLEGRTFEEIGEELQVNERTARRVLSQVTEDLGRAD